MKWYSYKPFVGDLASLEGPELAALKEVSEGWFVDYKLQLPSAKDLARHLSAFANQHGGWLFIGIKEGDQPGMTAGSFPGIPVSSIDSALIRLREASSAHISPEVHFETKVVQGPVEEINLPSDHAIIVVGIPEGTNPPYIHSSGRIYRRVADHSDPKPETDRGVLDLLWSRGNVTRQRLADFLTGLPKLSEEEAKAGRAWGYVYFLSSPDFTCNHFNLSFHDFYEIMARKSDKDYPSIPLENVFATTDGFLARQTMGNDPLLHLLDFRWWIDGRARATLPVNVYDFDSVGPDLDPRQRGFLQLIRSQGFRGGRIAEMSLFMALLGGVVLKFLLLRKRLGITGTFFGKVRLCGMWRIVPFMDFKPFLERVGKYGFPVMQDDDLLCPPGLSSESLIEMVDPDWTGELAGASGIMAAMPLIFSTLQAIGIDMQDLLGEFGGNIGEPVMNSIIDSLKQKPIR